MKSLYQGPGLACNEIGREIQNHTEFSALVYEIFAEYSITKGYCPREVARLLVDEVEGQASDLCILAQIVEGRRIRELRNQQIQSVRGSGENLQEPEH